MSNWPDFIKYPDIKRLGDDENYGIVSDPDDVIIIQEKIDGGNAQFRLWEDNILFGTRNNHFTILNMETSPQRKQFGENAKYVFNTVLELNDGDGIIYDAKTGIDKMSKLNPDYLYFGEWCKKHTINYNWETMPKFVGFDIMNVMTRTFLPESAMREEFTRLGLPTVRALFKGKVSEIDITRLENFIDKSVYYDGLMEGIVIKNYHRKNVYGRQLFAKIVRQEFKEANMTVFGGGVKNVKDDTSKFLEMFYTEARIKKAIFRLRDEGVERSLERSLMSYLPKAVADDVFKEEGWTLIKEFDTIDFRYVKKAAPKLCLRVLDQVINEQTKQALVEQQGGNRVGTE